MGIGISGTVRRHQHAGMRVLVAEDDAVNKRPIGAILQSLSRLARRSSGPSQ